MHKSHGWNIFYLWRSLEVIRWSNTGFVATTVFPGFLACYAKTSSPAVQKRHSKVYGNPIAPSMYSILLGNAQLRYTQYAYYVLCCGRNVNKPSALTEVEEKGLKLWFDITVQQKTKLIYQVTANTWFLAFWSIWKIQYIFLFHPLGPFLSKIMRCPWILVLMMISSHYSTQIWRIKYGKYFLLPTIPYL